MEHYSTLKNKKTIKSLKDMEESQMHIAKWKKPILKGACHLLRTQPEPQGLPQTPRRWKCPARQRQSKNVSGCLEGPPPCPSKEGPPAAVWGPEAPPVRAAKTPQGAGKAEVGLISEIDISLMSIIYCMIPTI